MKTTLRTLLAVTTLFTLLTTAIANSNQGPCSDLCFTIASAYYGGDTHAASQQLISLRSSSDTLETLIRTVTSNYYQGDFEAAAAALSGPQRVATTDTIDSLVRNVASNYHDRNEEAALEAITGMNLQNTSSLSRVEPDPFETLLQNVASNYYAGNIEAATLALSSQQQPTGPVIADRSNP